MKFLFTSRFNLFDLVCIWIINVLLAVVSVWCIFYIIPLAFVSAYFEMKTKKNGQQLLSS